MNQSRVSKRKLNATFELPNQSKKPRFPNASSLSTAQILDDARPNLFEQLPDELLAIIIAHVPIHDWPSVESVDHQFQRGVHSAWRNLRHASLSRFLPSDSEPRSPSKNAYERKAKFAAIVTILIERSPNLESIGEFNVLLKSIELHFARQLIHFKNLRRIDFSDCHVQPRHLAEFLSTSGSRGRLEDLRLDRSLRFNKSLTPCEARGKRHQNDEALRPAFGELDDRPSLQLKRFSFRGSNAIDGAFLDDLNVSQLEVLSVRDCQLSPMHVARLLDRSTRLIELDMSVTVEYRPSGAHGPNPSVVAEETLEALATLKSPYFQALTLEWTVIGAIPISAKDFETALSRLGVQCPRMTNFVMSRNLLCTVGVIKSIGAYFPNLIHLDLDITQCPSMVLVDLVSRLHRLQMLRFYSASWTQSLQINGAVIRAIATQLHELIELNLHLPAAKDTDFRTLNQLPKLTTLRTCGKHVTGKIVFDWCRDFGNRLEILELENPSKLTDSTMAIGARELINIRRLCLRGAEITDVTLRTIAVACPKLEHLDLFGCSRVTGSGVQNVFDMCTGLRYLRATARPMDFSSKMEMNRRVSIKLEKSIWVVNIE